jgi:glyoxylase-like metal-dependent hydrolase (beta-lactamase superfamily II)
VVPGLSLTPVNLDRSVSDGDVLNLMGLRIEVRHVPGHCPGNVLFYVEARRAAFVGDVIFAGSVGRTDFPGGDPAVLRNSILKRVYTLPPATVLYPGHGPKTSVEHEFRTNPYVRG